MQGDDPGLAVARIALGCGNFGGIGSAPDFFGQGLTEDEAFALMDAAFEAGIDWFFYTALGSNKDKLNDLVSGEVATAQ